MKILLINYEFPPLGGGAGNATQNLAREFVNLGNEVLVLTSAFARLPKEETVNGYKIIRIPSNREYISQCNPSELPLFCLSAFMYLPKIIRNWRPDKTIAFFSIPSGIVAWYLKVRYKIPYIVSLRGADVPGFWKDKMKFLHWLTLPLNKLVWKTAERVVVNGEGLREVAEITSENIGVKIDLIPNGVNTDVFKPPAQKINNSGKFRILFVGRLTTQKRPDVLIRALGELIKKDFAYKEKIICEIIGDGPMNQNLRDLSKQLNLEDIVTFSAWVDRKELPVKYQSADIFILPSADEGMANVFLEAMASGLPIIASDIPANKYFMDTEKSGVLFKAGDPVDLAEKIIFYIKNPELKIKQGAGNLLSAKRYTWEFVARGYLQDE